MGLNYNIQYKKGTENTIVDAHSKMHKTSFDCNILSEVQTKWVEEIISSYEGDLEVTHIFTQILIDLVVVENVALQNGMLKYKGKV